MKKPNANSEAGTEFLLLINSQVKKKEKISFFSCCPHRWDLTLVMRPMNLSTSSEFVKEALPLKRNVIIQPVLNFWTSFLCFFFPFCQVCTQSCSKAILSRTILNQTTADVTHLCVVQNEYKIPTSRRTKAWRHKQPWDVLRYKNLRWKLLLSFLLIFIKTHEAILSFMWLFLAHVPFERRPLLKLSKLLLRNWQLPNEQDWQAKPATNTGVLIYFNATAWVIFLNIWARGECDWLH